MTNILITSMGGSGSLNIVDSLRLLPNADDHHVVGTHFNPYELAKSDLEDLYIVPKAADEAAFMDRHFEIIKKHEIDVLIANSDIEAAVFTRNLDRVECHHLLPIPAQVDAVQDKYDFHRLLHGQGCATVPNLPVSSIETLGESVAGLKLDRGERYWIRLRSGSGSQGATWLYTIEQGQKWMELWCELRNMKPTDFVVAPFLSGRDFCASVLFQDGDVCVGKVYERLEYYTEDVSLSMMGSTPKTSRTIAENEPVDATIEAVKAICHAFATEPHGLYQADLKCDEAGTPYVTEINIGRFPMTSPQFDRVGKHSQLAMYLELAQNPKADLPRDVYDFDPGWVFLRGVDVPLVIERNERIEALSDG